MSNSITSPATGETRIRAAIARAADTTGVDFDYLYNQARIESSLDPAARAQTSSAAGLFQFTKDTWLQVVKEHGAEHGLGWAADAIVPGGRGLTVADPALRSAIDQLRFDPATASAMAGAFASDNRDHLESSLGRDTEPVDLYLAHFLGAGGATRFLKAHEADASIAAAPLFPQAAAANHSIFYGRDGSARSLGEIRSAFAAKLGSAAPLASAPQPVPRSPTWTSTQRSASAAIERQPLEMASIERVPDRPSLDFATRAYRRLAGLGA
jgi:hypothetical protein